jgi:transcriptional regulator with XRE-family HTH domain
MPHSRNRAQDPPDERQQAIGKRLRDLRKRRGLTQQELAGKISLTREAVASYETGRARLTDASLIDLAAALRVSSDQILGLDRNDTVAPSISRRWAKRIRIIESLPDSIKKHILRTLDDVIKANTRLSIFDDEP